MWIGIFHKCLGGVALYLNQQDASSAFRIRPDTTLMKDCALLLKGEAKRDAMKQRWKVPSSNCLIHSSNVLSLASRDPIRASLVLRPVPQLRQSTEFDGATAAFLCSFIDTTICMLGLASAYVS
jgi:hypothetical protein